MKTCAIYVVRFHDLRHIHASLLLTSGVPVHVVSARLGHASIQTTVDTYGHVLPASDVEAGRVMERRLAE
jgi:integrase